MGSIEKINLDSKAHFSSRFSLKIEYAKIDRRSNLSKIQSKLYYTRTHRHFLNDALPKESSEGSVSSKRHPELTSADYHSGTRILVTGFSSGVFLIHELPEASLVHSLSISGMLIKSTINWTFRTAAFGIFYLLL